ncbi:MAG: hypothetical protein JEY94_18055 [Melioribacteraceae bacterium]|nr:hypothetical protein [Melioribacteraceae bacterium]
MLNKNSCKFPILFALFTLLVFAFSFGCQDDGNVLVNPETNNDAALIKAIQEANKQSINEADLPSSAKTVLESGYSESYVEEAKMAPQLGYEVGLRRGLGTRMGERNEAYFDINGRELIADGKDPRNGRGSGDDGKDRKECFSLVLPVNFTMPDGSTITIENDEGWMAIREWFETNPESREKPLLQYPVDIKFEDGTISTINSDEEMEAVYLVCGDDGDGGRDGGNEGECFVFILPVSYTMPDGSSITIGAEEDWVLIREWYEANTGVRDEPVIQYPVDVLFLDDTTRTPVTVNNEEEMRGIYSQCDDGGGRP